MDTILFISCIFGTKFKKVHLSPDKDNSFFFTNNPTIKEEVIKKNWRYIYVNMELTNDIIKSSLQSKYIKFLIFLKDYPQFDKYNKIVYFDHKENVSNKTIIEIKKLIQDNSNSSLIIRRTPSLKTKIQDEINAAMGQKRYRQNIEKTKMFVDHIIKIGEASQNVRICNTGLLIYINRENINELLNDVYNKCIEHTQPECQIYWALLSQKYKNLIKEIEWTYIKNIKRYIP